MQILLQQGQTIKTLNLRAAKKSTDGKTLKFWAAKLKGFTVFTC